MSNFIYPVYELYQDSFDNFLADFNHTHIEHLKNNVQAVNVLRALLFLIKDKDEALEPPTSLPMLRKKLSDCSDEQMAKIIVTAPYFKPQLLLSDEQIASHRKATSVRTFTTSYEKNKFLNFYRLHKDAFKDFFTNGNRNAIAPLLLNSAGMTLNILKLFHYFDEDANGQTSKHISADELALIEQDLDKAHNTDVVHYLLNYHNFYNFYNVSNKSLIAMIENLGKVSYEENSICLSID